MTSILADVRGNLISLPSGTINHKPLLKTRFSCLKVFLFFNIPQHLQLVPLPSHLPWPSISPHYFLFPFFLIIHLLSLNLLPPFFFFTAKPHSSPSLPCFQTISLNSFFIVPTTSTTGGGAKCNTGAKSNTITVNTHTPYSLLSSFSLIIYKSATSKAHICMHLN